MNFNFNANNIIYVDIIGKTITFKLKNLDVSILSITYNCLSSVEVMKIIYINKFNLKETDKKNQFIPITD